MGNCDYGENTIDRVCNAKWDLFSMAKRNLTHNFWRRYKKMNTHETQLPLTTNYRSCPPTSRPTSSDDVSNVTYKMISNQSMSPFLNFLFQNLNLTLTAKNTNIFPNSYDPDPASVQFTICFLNHGDNKNNLWGSRTPQPLPNRLVIIHWSYKILSK